jgi:two-component system cell cycle sensor histidine kinase/response regulator CckA
LAHGLLLLGAVNYDRPIRVLIVDDDRVDRGVYRECLRHSSVREFEFAEAESAISGLEIVGAWRPDCTLLDFNLPDMDGIEVLSRLRHQHAGLPCATVMLTAYGGEELAVRAMKAGASDYLPKGRVSAGTLAPIVINAVQRFWMLQQIEQQRSALAISERRYQILLEAIPQMVWSASPEGRVEYANRRWCEYTGLAFEEAEGAHLGWDRLLHPEDRERTWSAWTRARESGSIFEIEHRVRRASDGSYRWHLVRAVPLRTSTGEISNWLGTCTDIEDQKQAGNAVYEEQKAKGIGQLAGGVAHDFNNLLVCILGGASRAAQSLPASHAAQEMLRDVIDAGERLAELTRRMLTYAGKASFHLEPANVGQIVQDACDGIRQSIPKTISLEIRSGPALPLIRTDPQHMRQAIVDLVLNAVEAIGDGSLGRISIHTDAIEIGEESIRTGGFGPGATSGKYVALEVQDTGCGMDEATRNKIFDPYFTTKFMGRGLGLAAIHGFVRSTGGCVQVDSQPGRGSVFRMLLPVSPAEGLVHNAWC